ncbi:MAG TPA: DinB family protein [Anaerolineales bacterium]|nr:DinB family protein [Anaerolineales bacterium]
MKSNEIITFFDYNFWAFDRVWECISQISDEQFVEEIDYSTGSIRNLVVHVMGGNRNWMSRLQGTEMSPRLVFADFDSLSKTKAKWDELQEEFLDHLNSLDQEQLDETVEWELLSQGLRSTNPRWEILLHLANHGTDHRAQILAILHHHFHIKTVEQDMIIYLAERNQK